MHYDKDLKQFIETPHTIKTPNIQSVSSNKWQKMRPDQQHQNCVMAFARQPDHTFGALMNEWTNK